MNKILAWAVMTVIAAVAAPALAQHDDCYLTRDGMSGPGRCESNGHVGAIQDDICVLSVVGGWYRQRDNAGGFGDPPGGSGDGVHLIYGDGPYWTLLNRSLSYGDDIRSQASCVPKAQFNRIFGTIGNTMTLLPAGRYPIGPPNNSFHYSGLPGGGTSLCLDREFTGNARVFNDSVDNTGSGSQWDFEVWGNPDPMGGAGGCITGIMDGVSTTYVVSWLQPDVQLPDPSQALCGFVRVSGPFVESDAYVSISVYGTEQWAHASPGGGDTNVAHYPSATVQCAYF